ncbi:YdaS family helix-turn-helix protein [Ralstonia pseudosolanacearum]|nr:YdaS family helix-turn-helix protein [Ralstonia pseudosolanacearum]MDO3524521.1 YdaS family helix-turn-helix protein [Ralstonia pseudosolanacearum]MDO3552421.1 YdaS family helix-turn-helix protein [Ralstonia pseudosolanacearum]MDO3591242.1 YdaS family helix-turn-helix protein [Ralstonia pseudosolanacearum]MDO3595732.1 YdaS family helix-turn-helix protein [Ralstonia pseudosolanacearum]MDO3601261.1 YdaS family helix-turn-helix protein [Ralstonia pseudosolanacearum]
MLSLGYSVKSDAQIRQWRHGYAGRRPDPENCVGLELATGGAVTRKEMRPDDWQLIWPEFGARDPSEGQPRACSGKGAAFA